MQRDPIVFDGPPLVTALQAMTISTENPDALRAIFIDALGWELLCCDGIDAQLENQWGIAAGSAGTTSHVLRSPGADRGMVRILRGVERQRSLAMATRWAGVEMIVSHDLDDLYHRLTAHPAFHTFQPPATWDWTEYGSNIHRAFIGQVPGGTHLAFTMGLTKPQSRDFPTALAQVGHVFDVPLVTTRFAECAQFYCGTLGMQPFLQSHFQNHLWQRLWKLPAASPVDLDIVKGDAPGTGLGGIELQGYEIGLVDEQDAKPNQLDGGACMVSYTSHRLDAAYAAVAADPSVRLLSSPRPIAEAPYHGARTFAFQGPVGERFEICEAPWR